MSHKHWKTIIAVLGFAASAAAVAQEPEAPQLKQKAYINFNGCAKPHYPSAELTARHQGTVTLRFQVGTDGKVIDSTVGKSSGFPALDEAARSALASCQFQPAIAADGQPVAVWLPVQYVWSLK
jgi:TonB family protein